MKTSVGILLFCSFLLFSCTKEVQGPKGDPGPQGEKGDPGPQGPAGGGAVIQSTGKILVLASQWVQLDEHEFETTITTPAVTQKVVESGSVQVYLWRDDSWHNLPFMNHTNYITFSYQVGKVKLIMGDSHGGTPDVPVDDHYKVVTLSGAGALSPRQALQVLREDAPVTEAY